MEWGEKGSCLLLNSLMNCLIDDIFFPPCNYLWWSEQFRCVSHFLINHAEPSQLVLHLLRLGTNSRELAISFLLTSRFHPCGSIAKTLHANKMFKQLCLLKLSFILSMSLSLIISSEDKTTSATLYKSFNSLSCFLWPKSWNKGRKVKFEKNEDFNPCAPGNSLNW